MRSGPTTKPKRDSVLVASSGSIAMGRYPSSDVERIDQQWAETESERNERLRRKRLKASSPYGEMCRDPTICAGKGYCPRDPTCGD